jgi:glycosyltransferase involved in cell wall biosynthesis
MRALYVCYLSLDDPLTRTQVVAYLGGLATAGHDVHLLTFEVQPLTRSRRAQLSSEMSGAGITWHGLRYHKRPSLPATVFDTFAGAVKAAWLARRLGIDVVHARSHVPAAMTLIARRLARRPPALIFDIRGLMAEEYVDAGRWRQGGIPWRLTKAVERAALRRADGVVVLTERTRRQLFGEASRPGIVVIPCCADLGQIESGAVHRADVRARLGLGDDPVLVYVGKFTGWYMAREMAEFFVRARSEIDDLQLLVLTQGDREDIERELLSAGAPAGTWKVTSSPHDEVGAHLAAADAAISFIRPSPSKASSSPTKIGEYLAAGLPVVATAGVGDLDEQLRPDVAVLVAAHDERAHRDAARALRALIDDPATAERGRALAHRLFSLDEVGIPRYRELYDDVDATRSLGHPAWRHAEEQKP